MGLRKKPPHKPTREELAGTVHLLRRKQCSDDEMARVMRGPTGFYLQIADPPASCDCRRKATLGSLHSMRQDEPKNGCPELRDVEDLLLAMSIKEFQSIWSRVEELRSVREK